MSFGLKIYDESGNPRLDVADRQIRFIGLYTGTLTMGTPVEVTVPGMTNDGTWGINELSAINYTDISIGQGKFTLNSAMPQTNYRVQVFRI